MRPIARIRFAASACAFAAHAAALAAACAGSGCVHTQQVHDLVAWGPEAPAIVIEDTTVFPATGTGVLEHRDVVVTGKRITAVRPTGEGAQPPGAVVIDGRGKTLLPGLVDAHVHTQVTGAAPWYVVMPRPEHVLQEALYAGTTTIHDMGGPVDDVIALKRAVADGSVIGPRMLVAGPLISANGGYPESYIKRVLPLLAPVFLPRYTRVVDSPASGKELVDELVDDGVDQIKICLADTPDGTAVLDAATVRAITAEAHARGKKVFAHIDTSKNARLAADNGVDVLAHGVHSTELSVADAEAIAKDGTKVVPTLITFERLYELSHGTVSLSRTEQETVATNIQRSLARVPRGYTLDGDLAHWLEHLTEHRHARLHENVSRLRDAGARILVGTDGHGSTASFPAGIHEEMRRLVEAGIPNAEVLLGATAWSAHASLDNPSFGTVEPGKDADLLLIDGDPLVDITATERIDTIILRGRVVRRLR